MLIMVYRYRVTQLDGKITPHDLVKGVPATDVPLL